MKLKNYLSFLIFCILSFSVFSQEENKPETKEKSEFWKKVRFGGGLGLDFTNNVTSVNISPSAIYQANSKFYTGAGINFGYQNFRASDTRQFNYGVSLINLYNPVNGLQLSGELEYTFVNRTYEANGVKLKDNFNFPSLFIGAGYNVGNFSAGLRYDLLYNEDKSLYSSALVPFARVFF